jgi:beta-glucosidase
VIDESVSRILKLKYALGLFEHPYTDEAAVSKVILTPEHIELARKAAEESFVLLRNEPVGGKPLLPLEEGKSVTLIGRLADSQVDMLGAWTMRGKKEDVVTLRQTLAAKLKDKLTYVAGVDPASDSEDGLNEAVAAAAKSDIVIMALGETAKMSGEAACRSTLDLPGKQLKMLQAVVATGKPVVLVLFNGRPLSLPWESEHVPAILEAWFPGVQTGPAVVNALYGTVNPSGKLTASFPRSVGQMPLYYNVLNTGRPALNHAPADGYITGYLDQRNTALYPFGHGLSYTSFSYSPTTLSTKKATTADLNNKGEITVQATVQNTGKRDGEEVVQLYIRQRGASVARPVRELKGFEKIKLKAGESKQVKFTLTRNELAIWNAELKNTVETGELTVWIAPDSVSGTSASLTITN